jgi:nitrogen regulatory protein P-II 2
MSMALTKHSRTLLVIVAEAALEKRLVADAKRLGAHGYTVHDVRGEGSMGVREGAWEADRTIEMKVICEAGVADQIAEHVLAHYAADFGVTMFFTEAQVLRPHKF